MTDLTPCPVCGTPGGNFNTHVCMTSGVPSHVAERTNEDWREYAQRLQAALDAERARAEKAEAGEQMLQEVYDNCCEEREELLDRNRSLEAVAEAARDLAQLAHPEDSAQVIAALAHLDAAALAVLEEPPA